MDRDVWSSFSHDPRDRRYQSLRASDQDRSVVVSVLAEAYADGRLGREEFDERSDAARSVRSLGDVNPLLADLVPVKPPPGAGLVHATRSDLEQLAERHWQAKRREATFTFLGVSGVTTVIWAALAAPDLSDNFFWPIFVIAFTLFNLARTVATRREIVAGELRRLERRREKDQRRTGWLW